MSDTALIEVATPSLLLGDEAVALAAVDSGIVAAYSYPGTPATEIMEYLLQIASQRSDLVAAWSVNEKTAYEQALGVSMVGKRSLVSMKHVGLNVAADPFMNSAIVDIRGGLVVAVADDPSMHSSQNEQDSRYMADFAHVICLEPANQQEAYDMTRQAFELSEKFHIPVLLRLVTRLAHSRSAVHQGEPEPQRTVSRSPNSADWILLPVNARRQWHRLLDQQVQFMQRSEESEWNVLVESEDSRGMGDITTGIARNYYEENLPDLDFRPDWLHIGMYPIPLHKIRAFAQCVDNILVLEDGYPYLERYLRGVLTANVRGRLSGHLSRDGELTPENVRHALRLPARPSVTLSDFEVPARPPQLCAGCPHREALDALHSALNGWQNPVITGDIGCYTLGALPPYEALNSCVCMGASVGMAKGASDAGVFPVVALIGDSTFCHSGVTPLMDAAAADTDMLLIILDNEAVGMTGAQDTLYSAEQIHQLALGLGVAKEHCHLIETHPTRVAELAQVMRSEIEHHGLSVIVCVRECLEKAKRRKKAAAAKGGKS
ncbi:MAG TPA: thiamine pyrophosphate-dependent enzyme [Acidobacteriota bacterium]|nr:thiamine pyrophosphate-dependent enzyme [Acidobacteriota bacterium]